MLSHVARFAAGFGAVVRVGVRQGGRGAVAVAAGGAVERDAGVVQVDPVERGGEAVGVALAAHLAVGDDVDAGAFHVADGDQGGIVLRFLASPVEIKGDGKVESIVIGRNELVEEGGIAA